MKIKYNSPEFHFVRVEFTTVLMDSPENYNSYIDDNPTVTEPIIEPDDDIIW